MTQEGREGAVIGFCLGEVGVRSLTKGRGEEKVLLCAEGRTLSKNNSETEGSWLCLKRKQSFMKDYIPANVNCISIKI